MSNEIYPLEKDGVIREATPDPVRFERIVNRRLAPIFKALLDDPDGWVGEHYAENHWMPVPGFPTTHEALDNFRLVPKHKTIPVEIPVPHLEMNIETYPDESAILIIPFKKHSEAVESKEAIRSAMEGK